MTVRRSLVWAAAGLLSVASYHAVARAAAASGQGSSQGFLQALAALSYQVETVADDVALVCRGDVSDLAVAGARLAEIKKLDQVLVQLQRRYGALAEFPSAEARRIGGRIASLEDSLVRLYAAPELLRPRGDDGNPSGQLFFEAVQSVCPDDDAASVFDDVCKAQGGTPGEECEECFFGLLTCCEKICSVG